MNEKKLISLIVPIYNEEKNINAFYQAVKGVFPDPAGSFDCELIFVNDGSTDQSQAVIEKLAQADKRIRQLEFSTTRQRDRDDRRLE